MILSQFFDLSLRGRTDRPALEWQGATLTFGDLRLRSARMAGELRARGVGPGDRVAVYLPNGLLLIDIYLACARIGAIFVPINILYRERELTHILEDAAPSAVVAPRDGLPPNVATCVWLADDLDSAATARVPDEELCVLDGDAPAMLVYTSGTTGRSKGAVLTHNNLIANAVALLAAWQITESDRLLLALPLFHVHGLGNGLHCWLGSGCLVRLVERFDHTRMAEEFFTFDPTVFFGVPTMYTRLVEWAPETTARIGARVRLFVSGSAALSPQTFEQFRTAFGHDILERYGMSETLMTVSNPYVGQRRPGTIGFPLPGVSARILDDAGCDVDAGAIGELYVKGPTVCSGYWRHEAATRAAFVDGFFRTGDLASRGSDGVFTLHGRRGDLIISGGFNIYPREIEEVLEEHSEIVEAAVVGVPDARRGEVPVAFVVFRTAPSEPAELLRQVEEHCRTRLASFKVPRSLQAVDRLPRNALGKIQKVLLPRDRNAGGTAGEK